MTFEEWKLAKTWHECLERQIVDETAAHLVEWMEAWASNAHGDSYSVGELLIAVKEYVNGKGHHSKKEGTE